MTRNAARLLAPVLAMVLVATACGGGGGPGRGAEDLTEIANDIRGREAREVEPPEELNAKMLPPSGIILQSNSPTWRELLDGPSGRGVYVIFIAPGSILDGRGVARGDLLTEVNGTSVYNPDVAIAEMHSQRGEKVQLKFTRRGTGKEREIEVSPRLPRYGARRFLDGLVKGNPRDPVLRFARAASGGPADDNLADLKVALEEEPDFAEALSSRGANLFRQIRGKDKKAQQASAGEALANWKNALDVNPRHAETLARRAAAQTRLGRPDTGKSDALRALRFDPTLPAAHQALAEAELARKKPEDAAGPARAAIELNPFGNLHYYRTLAAVFKALKREKDCQTTFNAPIDWLNGTKLRSYKLTANNLKEAADKSCK